MDRIVALKNQNVAQHYLTPHFRACMINLIVCQTQKLGDCQTGWEQRAAGGTDLLGQVCAVHRYNFDSHVPVR